MILMLASSVAACGLPRSGPNMREIMAGSVENGGDSFIVTVTPQVNRLVSVPARYGFSSAFQNAGEVGPDTISSGDQLTLTVFENVRDDPLLGNSGQRVSALNEVQVGGDGFIFVPYAGRIRAAGQTPEALRQTITRSLENQTPDPQVLVQRKAGDGATVSVSGTAGTAGVFPLGQPSRTLLRVLSLAGGVTSEPSATVVRVTRGGQTGQVWLQDLYDNPNLDIALRNGDVITVERDRRRFMSLGATGQSVVPFERANMSALEAIAQVGGLQTNLANPSGVFVFRDEPASTVRSLTGRADVAGPQRVAYVLNLTQPSGMFEARDFLIKDGDTLYVTEAPFVQWTKTIQAILGTTSAANNITQVGN
ncbi:polysaccharide biosynthesis/export family protein [Falsirhodobacter halotolerans]|uniref:polysaccharide biosynthesis/export family protein n=1 Tax=Falsirhodobacter halotolerans TaxID=1146892 RepID=UPI001FD5A6C9|nr:polysaccharide biosynthesis/export family protein [Falsirhodobacter halotolerans]MCJ8139917.1 polysaccharide biosynthesis/export family protein [Falsirhodobacter halotolerans]